MGLRATPAWPEEAACHQEPGKRRLMGMRRSPITTVHAPTKAIHLITT
jgi:hypothetical protein